MDIPLPHVPQFGASRSMTSSGGRVFSLCKKLATIKVQTVFARSSSSKKQLGGKDILSRLVTGASVATHRQELGLAMISPHNW
jgi:hypothetical protein